MSHIIFDDFEKQEKKCIENVYKMDFDGFLFWFNFSNAIRMPVINYFICIWLVKFAEKNV